MTQQILSISEAEYLDGYRIRLRFNDGKEQTVDFYPFLGHSSHPAIRAYLDPQRFNSFRIEHGDLVWGDYDLCFPIIDLYRNVLDHSRIQQEAA
ncbi:MAG: DUF2442 domain-containing protein [Sulfuricella sp.]|nr:DUF2442 domain-containing protein [Sulfuricella sp.]